MAISNVLSKYKHPKQYVLDEIKLRIPQGDTGYYALAKPFESKTYRPDFRDRFLRIGVKPG